MRMKVGEGILIYGVIGLFILLALVPFLCLISGSFSESDLLRDYGVALWPRGFTADAYRLIFMFPEDILNSYYYSILITVIGTIGNMLLLTSVAYVLSRPALRGKKYMSMFFFFTLMFNPGIVPTFILYDYLGMYDTIWALIFPGMMSVGYLYLLRAFFDGLPAELYESAHLDGANEFTIMLRIAVPLITPGLSTVTFYSVLNYWNDGYTGLIYAQEIVPVAIYLSRITNYIDFLKNGLGTNMGGIEVPDDTMIYAMSIVATGPMLVIFVFFQKYFVRGLTAGSVKG